MVLVTATLGFYLAEKGINDWASFWYMLLGIGLVCGGACAGNHIVESKDDIKMTRTQNRPIPAKIISPLEASIFTIIITTLGTWLLSWKFSWFLSLSSLATALLYIYVYTPFKKIHWINTTIGAIPGALPPVGGWVAVTGIIHWEAIILFLFYFFGNIHTFTQLLGFVEKITKMLITK